jgi:hypothetical protein
VERERSDDFHQIDGWAADLIKAGKAYVGDRYRAMWCR